MINIIFKEVDYDNQDFTRLSIELDSFLNQAIGGESIREKYKKFNNLNTMDYVVVAYDGKTPIGCGALRKYSPEEIEVKRVFLREEYRENNVGGMLLERLISKSKELGFQRMILETGDFLEASVRLYSRYGFERIANYGEYAEMEESVCMARPIGREDIIYCVDRRLSEEDIRRLFLSAGWMSADYADRLSKAFRKAGTVLTAWQGDRLIGLAETLADGGVNAYVHYLLVDPAFHNRGIGASIMKRIKKIYQNYLYLLVISEKKDTVPFYEKLDFKAESDATVLQILTP